MKKYMNTISPEELKERLYVFASNDFEGRRTGTRGQKRAAEFLSNFYFNNGLEGPIKDQANPYLQPIDFMESVTKGGSITLGENTYTLNKDYAVLNGIGSSNTSDVVFIGYGIQTEGYNDLEGLDLEGKAVVMLFGEPTTSEGDRLFEFSQQESFAEKMFSNLGISNMIVSTPNQMMFNAQFPYMKGSRARISLKEEDQDVAPFSTFFMSPEKVADMFGMSSDEFFKKIQDKVDAKEPSGGMFSAKHLTIELDKTDRNTVSHNVMGYIEGSDLKDELIVISSHYDHDGIKNGVIYPGADDDASGTMGVIEIAQAFSQAK
ncbi:MAG: M28 family peptidase, partial [Bacteroidia bacterium]|nr:M28 family peptidase [Bacteroidia bacterium]